MGFLDGIGDAIGLGGETTEDPTIEDPTTNPDTEDTTTTSGKSSGKTEEQKKAEEYQAKIPRKYACPFFKTMEQNEKESAEAMLKYKARTGLDHYVDPNSGMEAKDDA